MKIPVAALLSFGILLNPLIAADDAPAILALAGRDAGVALVIGDEALAELKPAEIGRFLAELQFSTIDEIFEQGLHRYLDEAQTKLNNIGGEMFNAYIFQPFQAADEVHMVQQEEQQQQTTHSRY